MSVPPQGSWGPPPGAGPSGPGSWGPAPVPPRRGGAGKWVLGALVLLVVVAVSVGTTLFFTRDRGDGGSSTASSSAPTSPAALDVASANDTGPVGIITEDPTCAAWTPIGDTLAAEQAKGWDKRDPMIPANAWTPDQRSQHEAIGSALRAAAEQTIQLARITPHRVMRELYEQTIAYWRAYADRIPTYSAPDDHLILVANSTSGALVWICSSITFGSAAARAPLVARAAAPSTVTQIGDPANPSRFLSEAIPVCDRWGSKVSQYNSAVADWQASVDPNLAAGLWPPDQRSRFTEVTPVLRASATDIQDLGMRSGNPVFEDFAVLAAQYQRAYVQAIPTYVPADNFLLSAASQLVAANHQACMAVGE